MTDPKDGDKGRVTPQTVRMELLREVLGICTWIEQTRQVVFPPLAVTACPSFSFRVSLTGVCVRVCHGSIPSLCVFYFFPFLSYKKRGRATFPNCIT